MAAPLQGICFYTFYPTSALIGFAPCKKIELFLHRKVLKIIFIGKSTSPILW
jgi:hypothetical protein